MDRLFLDKQDESDDMDLFDKDDTEGKKISNRDIIISKLNSLFVENLPEVQGDRIIQIGCVFHKFGKRFLQKGSRLRTCVRPTFFGKFFALVNLILLFLLFKKISALPYC